MSNYIVKIAWYTVGGVMARQTNLNLRNVTITDMESLVKAINYQFTERDGFAFNDLTRDDNYHIDMLCKVDDLAPPQLDKGEAV